MYRTEMTCCFTGHRPEKLPWGYHEEDERCKALKLRIYDAVEAAYGEGMRRFICGMARGCDMYCAEAVLMLREKHPDVVLEAAVPFAGQGDSWAEEQSLRWKSILERCDAVTVLQESYTPDCMHRRNRYMVDHSSLVIAVYDGSDGGTRRTLEYALRQKVPFVDIDPTGV